MKSMKIELIFEDWQRDCRSIYNTQEGMILSNGTFHSGSTFNGTIELHIEDEEELRNAIDNGFDPIFRISLRETK